MPTPEFILALRERVGTQLLFLTGVTAVVRNSHGEVLLCRRVDNGQWALVSGILEPGEQPAEGLRREIAEETGVAARIDDLTGVWTLPAQQYPNGDRAQYLDLCFTATYLSGQARVNDDESLEVGWFALDALPEMMERSRVRLERALAFTGHVWFERAATPTDRYAAGSDDGPPPAAVGAPLAALDAGGRPVVLRRATREDVPAVVALIADDQLGATRESPGELAAYLRAFAAIDADPAQLLVVLDDGGVVVGTMQLTVIPGLARGGALRAQVEAVRVAGSQRGQRLGEQLIRWAVAEASRRGCALVQLTTDKRRADAHRFYERLGFTASHEGFKMALSGRQVPTIEEQR
ncbi:ADP-ribose pyrophosphatase YjhB (NUDIX family)/GNAT superfamily N-acetyltransferase [Phycicoccus badiiscoriae]|uniref:ADP-ribose pyrophosphatase YjhB (NUDIX family)/GNAT superfamily N-acetyltransferase n=1 Tax=Pedococcus badiiscoriae TaxID=642776 RepID=A0A852WE98_9MICO|nr:ADP-ribose pyrophosphatase YjhB (NUDIX family)/GNAT superfamily N-acetyltransferase [Pedococcus badiiscoriae]